MTFATEQSRSLRDTILAGVVNQIGIVAQELLEPLFQESNELLAILTTIIRTVKEQPAN
jgi:hypothetical protein